jgi:hypothetical protein
MAKVRIRTRRDSSATAEAPVNCDRWEARTFAEWIELRLDGTIAGR